MKNYDKELFIKKLIEEKQKSSKHEVVIPGLDDLTFVIRPVYSDDLIRHGVFSNKFIETTLALTGQSTKRLNPKEAIRIGIEAMQQEIELRDKILSIAMVEPSFDDIAEYLTVPHKNYLSYCVNEISQEIKVNDDGEETVFSLEDDIKKK